MAKHKPYYGEPPEVLAEEILVDLVKDKVEMCFYQYLPIKMAGALENFHIPPQLEWIKRFIPYLTFDPHTDFIYVSVKHLFVTPDNMGNRPGWHTDGFGSDDVNYIWADRFPTQFALQKFKLSDDHVKSLQELEEQVKPENIFPYGANAFIRIDKYNVHRPPVMGTGFRTFLKFSVSKNRYNLQGNSHNYLIDYDWEMVPRGAVRNHPTADVVGKVEPTPLERIRAIPAERSAEPAKVGTARYDDREISYSVSTRRKLQRAIPLTGAGRGMSFKVHELVAEFMKYDLVETPIGAKFSTLEQLENEGLGLTLDGMIRRLLIDRSQSGKLYIDTMQATRVVVNALVDTGLFVRTKGKTAQFGGRIPDWTMRATVPVYSRNVQCLRLANCLIDPQ